VAFPSSLVGARVPFPLKTTCTGWAFFFFFFLACNIFSFSPPPAGGLMGFSLPFLNRPSPPRQGWFSPLLLLFSPPSNSFLQSLQGPHSSLLEDVTSPFSPGDGGVWWGESSFFFLQLEGVPGPFLFFCVKAVFPPSHGNGFGFMEDLSPFSRGDCFSFFLGDFYGRTPCFFSLGRLVEFGFCGSGNPSCFFPPLGRRLFRCETGYPPPCKGPPPPSRAFFFFG